MAYPMMMPNSFEKGSNTSYTPIIYFQKTA